MTRFIKIRPKNRHEKKLDEILIKNWKLNKFLIQKSPMKICQKNDENFV